MKKSILSILIILFTSLISKSQDIEGKWLGTFIQYTHNAFDVEMDLKKLSNTTFSANLKIMDGNHFGQYQVSGNICNKRFLEITAIFLMKENGASSWIDCLNGMWDLNEDENELTFTDTWIHNKTKNDNCKVKFIQKDMFACLRSSYLRKVMYSDMTADFDKTWSEYEERSKRPFNYTKNDNQKSETAITEKNEDREPVIETYDSIKNRPVFAKNEIEVSSEDIVIEYWDRYNEDGDSINLYINNKPILENLLLTKIKKSITVHLDKKHNYLEQPQVI